MKGSHPIHRRLLNHWIWQDKPFAKGQAWIDLILLANHHDGTILMGGKPFKLKRGQVFRSRLTLAKRWGWSRGRINRFISVLETEQMIVQQTVQQGTLITLLNYSKLHDSAFKSGTINDTIDSTIDGTIDGTHNKKNIKRRGNKKEMEKEKSSPEPKITFCFKTESWLHILPKDIQRWKKTYPACDIDYELQKMADWLIANPTKKKKNYKSFISRWLTSTQDKGGSKVIRKRGEPSSWLLKKLKEKEERGKT